jgi:hypothetical protein
MKHPQSHIEVPSQRALSWQAAWICVGLAAITFAVFGQTTGFGFRQLRQ